MWQMMLASAAMGAAQGTPGMASGTSNPFTDNSGWNVNFGGGNIDSQRTQSPLGDTGKYLPYVVAAVGVLIVWRLTRRAR